MRSRIHDDIQRLHGTMPLWGVDRWVPLGDLFVDVNILEQVSSNCRAELDDLWQDFTTSNSNYRNLDRIGLCKEQQRVSGLAVLDRNTNLMVVGKPGSGKTTYLQRIVTECNDGKLQAYRIPVLIKLREFLEDGREYAYNLKQFLGQHWLLTNADSELVLNQGRALVLLDGLDEVPREVGKQIAKEIKRFTRVYPQVQVVVTCRTQSQESRFERFDYAEVADFNEEQVRAFVAHWFRTVCADVGERQAQEFFEHLFREENKPIRELIITPILLSLTCAVFQQTGKFYSQRSKLYQEGLELLLEQWDEKRGIERDEIYRGLSVDRKLELLSYIAVKKFEQQQYVLFEQHELECYIGEFLKIERQDSRAVLRAIESQHGLLIERSQKVWSFSHLTFQEYLVAKRFFCNNSPADLLCHIQDKHWKEIFLIAVENMSTADDLLYLFKEYVDLMLARDVQLQSYLIWLQNKSTSLKLDSELGAAVRSFYFAIDVVFDGAMNLESSSLFGVILNNSFQGNFILNDKSEISLDRYLQLTLDRAIDITKDPSFDIKLGFAKFRALKLNLKKILNFEFAYENPFWMRLRELLALIPNNFNSNNDFNMWWQENGVTWYQLLRSYMIEFRDIGHDWQFNYQQKKLITQYYDANKLLVDCLNNACPVSNAIKKEIEKRLFLPVVGNNHYINVKNG